MNQAHLQALIEQLIGDKAESEQAQKALVEMGSVAIEPLSDAIRQKSNKHAMVAIKVLGEMGDQQVVPLLYELLSHKSPLISGAAVTALLKLSPPDLAIHLMDVLPQSHIITQQTIVLALQELQDNRITPNLIATLPQMPSPTLKCAVIKTLGMLGDPSAIPVIQAYAHDEDHHIREWVEISLERLKGTQNEG